MLYNILKSNIIAKYNEAQLNGTGRLAPRNGFYYVRSIEDRDLQTMRVFIAHVNWKRELSDRYVQDAVFEVALRSINEGLNTPFKGHDPEDLIGKQIQIENLHLIYDVIDGAKVGRINCTPSFIRAEPEFTTPQNAFDIFKGVKLNDLLGCIDYDLNQSAPDAYDADVDPDNE